MISLLRSTAATRGAFCRIEGALIGWSPVQLENLVIAISVASCILVPAVVEEVSSLISTDAGPTVASSTEFVSPLGDNPELTGANANWTGFATLPELKRQVGGSREVGEGTAGRSPQMAGFPRVGQTTASNHLGAKASK